MNTQSTLSISEARKKIFEIADKVQAPNVYYVLTDKGRPKAVVLSAEEFESWVETLEVMQDFPDLKKDIREAKANYKSGNYITLEEFLTKSKVHQNALSSNPAKKGAKRSR